MTLKYSYSASPVFAGLVDYLKMNATTLGGSGYDQGRSGFSLLFFELADFLKDDALENLASDLLMQALLTQTRNISFDKGLSGIGYVLEYLIQNRLVDARFDELFAAQTELVVSELERIMKEDLSKCLSQVRTLRFLLGSGNGEYISLAISYLDVLQERINEVFQQILSRDRIYDLDLLANVWNCLLYIISLLKDYPIRKDVLKNYGHLYRSGMFKYDFETRYWFQILGMEERWMETPADLSGRILWEQRMSDVFLSGLREHSHFLVIHGHDSLLEGLEQKLLVGDKDKMEKELERIVPGKTKKLSLRNGIPRLVLSLIYMNSEPSVRKRLWPILMD